MDEQNVKIKSYLESVEDSKQVLKDDVVCREQQQTKQPRDTKERKENNEGLNSRSVGLTVNKIK